MFKRKSNYDSFDDFHQFSKYVKEAANYLHESLIDFDVSKLEEKLKTMHEIENNCDIHHHDTNAKLLGQYLPVIASEDVLKLNDLLDDIVDDIEDILIGIYTFNVLNIRSQAVAFSEVIIELSNALCEATSEFKNFKKSKSITRRLNDVNKLWSLYLPLKRPLSLKQIVFIHKAYPFAL